MTSSRGRRVELYCPSVSKLIAVTAMEDQKLDLGSIARTFGLNPATLKLNGHFITRGLDLISCSVTWKSLLSFFASKGLSTGTNQHDPLIVDGKLSNPGTKRARSPSGSSQRAEYNFFAIETKPESEDASILKKRKINESNPGVNGHSKTVYEDRKQTKLDCYSLKRSLEDADLPEKKKMNYDPSGARSPSGSFQRAEYNFFAIERKPESEDASILKKRKIKESNPGVNGPSKTVNVDHKQTKFDCYSLKRSLEDVDLPEKKKMNYDSSGRKPKFSNIISSPQSVTSCIHGSLKKLRGDVFMTTPYKRIR